MKKRAERITLFLMARPQVKRGQEGKGSVWTVLSVILSFCFLFLSPFIFGQEEVKVREGPSPLVLSPPLLPYPVLRPGLQTQLVERRGPVCGNGLVEPPETCDDRNNIPGDGCTHACEEEIVVTLQPITGGAASPVDCNVTLSGGGTFFVGQGGTGSASSSCSTPSGERERESVAEESIWQRWFGIPSAWAALSSLESVGPKKGGKAKEKIGGGEVVGEGEGEGEGEGDESFEWRIEGSAASVSASERNFNFICNQPGTTHVQVAYVHRLGTRSIRVDSNAINIQCQALGCGDGVVGPGETCNEPGLECAATMTCNQATCLCVPIDDKTCGNGKVDPGEECNEPGLTCKGGGKCDRETCICKTSDPPPSCPPDFRCSAHVDSRTGQCVSQVIQCGPNEKLVCRGSCSGSCNGQCCRCVREAVCGNGEADTGEQCGEPGLSCSGDKAGKACKNCKCRAVCGNGNWEREEGEECGEPGAKCPEDKPWCSECKCGKPPAACGDSFKDAGEVCGEPGLDKCGKGKICQSCQCVPQPKCGNRIWEPVTDKVCEAGAPDSPVCSPTKDGAPRVCYGCRCRKEAVCGNNIREYGETCDGTAKGKCGPAKICKADCRGCELPATCGNKELDPGEACDRSATGGDSCPEGQKCIDCVCHRVKLCKNGKIDPGESCEKDIHCPRGEVCDKNKCRCIPQPACYINGQLEGTEQCEKDKHCKDYNGDGIPDQKCQKCRCVDKTGRCGDGIFQPGEVCDPPGVWQCKEGERCVGCKKCVGELPAGCGDGATDPNEECGEPNLSRCGLGKDGQRRICQECRCVDQPLFCGDDIATNPPEQCGEPGIQCASYDGTRCVECGCITQASQCPGMSCLPASRCAPQPGGSSQTCFLNLNDPTPEGYCCTEKTQRCGDGIVQLPEEECDDGNQDNTDRCSTSCRWIVAEPCRTEVVTQPATGAVKSGCKVDCQITQEVCPNKPVRILAVKKDTTGQFTSDPGAFGDVTYDCKSGKPLPPLASDSVSQDSGANAAVCPPVPA